MNLSTEGQLRAAVCAAFVTGCITSSNAAWSDDTTPSTSTTQGTTQLKAVEVTGSHIRRVDTETADPIITLGRAYIAETGAQSIGELLKLLPNVAGGSSTTTTDNGAIGETNIGLRGLGSERTLLLLDGERLLLTNVDSIPINMIERVEVVKDGASSVYGSDAVGGVINIITRKNFKGFEATAEAATSNRTDGTQTQYTGTYGISSSSGHAVFGISYENQDPVLAKDRPISQFYLYQNVEGQSDGHGGSATTPFGRYGIPLATATSFGYNCAETSTGSGIVRLSRNAGASGANPVTDYHCNGASDTYNFQTSEYDLVPVQRTEIFGVADYKLFEGISWKTMALYNDQNATTNLAPEPYTSASYGGTIAANNAYNPFGVPIDDFRDRFSSGGTRTSSYDTQDFNIQTGFHGTVLDRFTWDALYNYQRELETTTYHGHSSITAVNQAIGPSIDKNTCGTEGSPIVGCVPLNVFAQPDATQLAAGIVQTDLETTLEQQHEVNIDVTGDLFTLPAGALSFAAGYDYRDLTSSTLPDSALQASSDAALLNENPTITDFSGGAVRGGFSVNEAYGELNIPLLANIPGAYSLTADIGERFSDYSNFGSVTNGKYGLEYKPTKDILLRGTYAQIFRAPRIVDLFGAATLDAPQVIDPCNAAPGQASKCAGFPVGYQDGNPQPAATITSNAKLKPEKGYTTSYGIVINPSFYSPLTLTADYFTYSIRSSISETSLQQSANFCAEGITSYCANVIRDPVTHDIANGTEPSGNNGRLLTTGLDYGAKLDYSRTRLGSFVGALDGTYLQKYHYTASPISATSSLAGQFLPGNLDVDGFGNFARTRLQASLTWSFAGFTALVVDRFVSSVDEYPGLNSQGNGPAVSVCGTPGTSGFEDKVTTDAGVVDCKRKVGVADYVNLSASYEVKPIHTELLLGVNNIGDEFKKVYSGFNDNTDVATYDSIGRYYYARVKFAIK